jgi:hypothetical protein
MEDGKDATHAEDVNQKTLKPFKSPATAGSRLPEGSTSSGAQLNTPASRSASTSQLEDYSDLGLDEDESNLSSKLANLKVSGPMRSEC